MSHFRFEWKEISHYLLTNNLQELKKYAIKGNLKTSKFRSICWSLFFGLLDNNDSNLWSEQRKEQRKYYDKLKEKFSINPQLLIDTNDDPLSQSDKSIWNQHFCDQELSAVIKQDVVRTFPGIDFFRKPQIQEIMISILFCYARENPIMCYRQGMHEILAPIIFVIHSDQQAFQHFRELNVEFDCPNLEDLLDSIHLEEDSFLHFVHVMSEIESYYRINDVIPTSTGYFPVSPYHSSEQSPENPCQQQQQPQTNKYGTEIVDQLNVIREKILLKEDPKLHNHLMQLDIPLSLFGIRWLRLLFGREFPLQDLLILWDAIFAEGEHFSLTNFIVVAMLSTIRDKLLSSDYTNCLTYLMKYPNTVDISHIIKLALFIKSPEQYPSPNAHERDEKFATLPRNIKSRQTFSAISSTPKVIEDKRRGSNQIVTSPASSSSSSSVSQTSYENRVAAAAVRVNGIQNLTARAAVKVAAQSHNTVDNDIGIIDGYRENDPQVSILTIQHAQNIMSLSRYKLIQYLAAIRKNLPNNTNEEIRQSLDGIEEVCALLKNFYTPSSNIPGPVEPAYEANEAGSSSSTQNKLNKNLSLDLPPPQEFHQTPPTPQSHLLSDLDIDSNNISYEIPVNSKIANQLFGNVREIPMRVFKSATSHDNQKCIMMTNDLQEMPTPDPTKERRISVEYEQMNCK